MRFNGRRQSFEDSEEDGLFGHSPPLIENPKMREVEKDDDDNDDDCDVETQQQVHNLILCEK